MKFIYFLKLIRYPNLLLILLIHCLLKFNVFPKFDLSYALDSFHFLMLTLSTMFLAAGGYMLNDIYDVATDLVNKPTKVFVDRVFPKKTVEIFYVLFNGIGILLGSYLSVHIGIPQLSILFILIALSLFCYSVYFKQMVLVGNITIAFLIGLSILIVPIFDLMPALNEFDLVGQLQLIKIIATYALFAFGLNFVREIIKDIEDINGDFAQQMNTLPIKFGRTRAKHIALLLSILVLIGLIITIISVSDDFKYMLPYGVLFLIIPQIVLPIKIKNAENNKDFKQLSMLLKIIMLFGVLSLVLIQ